MARLASKRIVPYGVNSDLSPHMVDPPRWSSATGVVFRRNRTENAEGLIYRTPAPTFAPQRLHYRNFDGANHWFYSNEAGLGLNVGAADYNVTPVGFPQVAAARETWTSLNSVPVYNHPEYVPLYHGGDPNVAMAPLPNWPAGWTCRSMRAFKFYLLAMDCKDAVDRYENEIRWSAAADAGNVPNEWLSTATNDAGSMILSAQPGAILDGMALRDEFFVYKNNSTYALGYLGGLFVLRQRTVFETVGILAKHCVAEWQGQHFLVSEGDVILHDGITARSVADKAVRRDIFSNIDPVLFDRSFCYLDPAQNQMVFYFPRSGSTGWCNAKATYTLSDGRWTIETVDGPEVGFAHTGAYNETGPGTTWADPPGVLWSQDFGRWNQGAQREASIDTLLALPGASQLGEITESGGIAGVPRQTSLTLLYQDLDNMARSKLVDRVWLEGSSAGNVPFTVQVGSSDSPSAPVNWGPRETVYMGNGYQRVVAGSMTKGRFISLKITTDALASWALDAIVFDYRVQGRYA